jgi:hypothetical protein
VLAGSLNGYGMLGRHPIPVPRIERRFPYVLQPENLGGQSFEPDSETAMWRHAEVEHFEMAFEGCRGDVPREQRTFEIVTLMEALAARCDLDTVEQQIEARRIRLRKRVGIERPRSERKSHYENRR